MIMAKSENHKHFRLQFLEIIIIHIIIFQYYISFYLILQTKTIHQSILVTAPQKTIFQKTTDMRKIFTTVLGSVALMTATAAPTLPTFAPAMRAGSLSDLPLINEQPAGELKTYSKNAVFFALDYMGQMYSSADYGRISEVVDAPDGKVYFKNPFCSLDTDSWLEGVADGETITVTFPQKIYSETYVDWEADPEGSVMKTDYFYAFKLLYSTDGVTSKMEMDLTNPSITFTRSDSGIVMDGDAFIGLMAGAVEKDADGEDADMVKWTRIADSAISLSVVDENVNKLPEGVAAEKWVMATEDGVRFVNVAEDGEDLYIEGVLSSMPGSVIKGKMADGKVIFTGPQYVGEDSKLQHFAYFFPADVSVEEDPEAVEPYVFTPAESVSFTYDKEAKAIYPDGDAGMAFSSIPQAIFLLEGYLAPEFIWQDSEEPMTPDNPEVLDYGYYDDLGYGAIAYTIPNWSTDGRLLDVKNLFYNFYLDNEILVLYPDEYPDLTEPMENIPAEYEDTSIYFWGDMYEAIIFPTGFDRIGVRSFYVNADGTKTYSDIVYNDGNVVSAVKALDTEAPFVERVEYFSIDGRRMVAPSKGDICIKRAVFSDGSVRATKIIKR